MNGPGSDAERVRVLRQALTATGAGIYLATHVAGPLSAETIAAAHESDELELRIGRAGPERPEDLELREREARAAGAAVINAAFDRVVLGHGAPDAARSLALEVLAARAGEPCRVLLIDGLAAPVALAIGQAARAAQARVEVSAELPRIVPADVALVAMARLDADGLLADPRPLADAVRRAGARLLVDASLSVGALEENVSELGADALVADVHRWLLGPEAMALLWLSADLGNDVPDRLRTAVGPFARAQLLSLARSVGWLLMYVGLPWAVARTGRLASQLRADLAAIERLELVPGPSGAAPLLAFGIPGWPAQQVADELSRSIFAITEVDAGADLLRISVGAWNREDELERFVERVAELAANTPTSLPRRPSLTIIHGPPSEGHRA